MRHRPDVRALSMHVTPPKIFDSVDPPGLSPSLAASRDDFNAQSTCTPGIEMEGRRWQWRRH